MISAPGSESATSATTSALAGSMLPESTNITPPRAAVKATTGAESQISATACACICRPTSSAEVTDEGVARLAKSPRAFLGTPEDLEHGHAADVVDDRLAHRGEAGRELVHHPAIVARRHQREGGHVEHRRNQRDQPHTPIHHEAEQTPTSGVTTAGMISKTLCETR